MYSDTSSVYDGHGGNQTALYTQEYLHSKLVSQPAFKAGDYIDALIKAFLDLDTEMLEGSYYVTVYLII